MSIECFSLLVFLHIPYGTTAQHKTAQWLSDTPMINVVSSFCLPVVEVTWEKSILNLGFSVLIGMFYKICINYKTSLSGTLTTFCIKMKRCTYWCVSQYTLLTSEEFIFFKMVFRGIWNRSLNNSFKTSIVKVNNQSIPMYPLKWALHQVLHEMTKMQC